MKYNIIALICGSILFAGCSDFLEPKSKSEFVPKDATSLNELLLGEAYPRNDIAQLNLFLNLMDDDISAAPYQEPQDGFDINLYFAAYTWQPQMYTMMQEAGYSEPNVYKTYYQLILGCNAVLDYIDDVVDEEANINLVKAQAYALRGFLYFKLVNIFGEPYTSNPQGLGVPLKLTSSIEEGTLARNTVEEVYMQIENDLLEAERLYKTISTSAYWLANTRTSLPMVQLMLSRTYLYMESWEKAASYANDLIQNTNFKLLDLNTVETVNEDGYPTYMNYHSYTNNPEVIWVYGNLADMVEWVSDNTESSDGRKIHPYFCASDGLMACLNEAEGDLRKDCYVTRSYFEVENEGGEPERMPQAFGKVSMASGEYYYRPSTGSSTFGRSLRLSEAYLNYMEAEAMLYLHGLDNQGLSNATTALNKLRKNRFSTGDYQAVDLTDINELIEFIKHERRRELCFEDHRWYDLRRWGMEEIQHIWYSGENSVMVYTLQANDPIYIVPIPDDALDLNGALQQIPLGTIPRSGENLSLNN